MKGVNEIAAGFVVNCGNTIWQCSIIKYQTITNLLQIMRKGEIVHFVLIGAWQTCRPRGQPPCFVKCAITEFFLKMGQPGLFFIYFCLFVQEISRQQDSNSDRRSRRQER